MKSLILLIASMFFMGCSEQVTSTYSTYSAAKQSGLFEKGWLPNILPKLTTHILVVNDLDNNTSSGNFTIKRTHINKFLAHLEPTNLINQYRFSDSNNTWLFIVNETGLVQYQLDKL